MGRRVIFILLIALAVAPAAAAAAPASAPIPGAQRLHFAAGPYTVTPGANLILLQYRHVPRPAGAGYLVRMAPNLHYARSNGRCCGTVPRVDVIHLHHGVWLSNCTAGQGEGASVGPFYPFMASGEEKTVYTLPRGYGYPVGASDTWVINYMIHNLSDRAARVYITYDLDFVPATSPAAGHMVPAHPIWMDVQNHSIYPVFDVHRGSGVGGHYTYPDMAVNPYGAGPPRNVFKVEHPGTLLATAGHVHPGGLHTDLDLIRPGVHPSPLATPGAAPGSVRLFRSVADYFDRRGPISWDMAMTGTPPDWRPQVRAGDVLRVSATYDTSRSSWYESMGIMVVWEAWNDTTGADPFKQPLDQRGAITHGHLGENDHHGGIAPVGPSLATRPSCRRRQVFIAGFGYLPGGNTAKGAFRCLPTIVRGQSLTFVNEDASPDSSFGNLFSPNPFYLRSVFHTITSCLSPCRADSGISYPLANGPAALDSGQLGVGTPATGSLTWSTPANLAPGTYTYYCRVHPFMRGAFRVITR